MPDVVQGFEEAQPETPWCIQCAQGRKWPGRDECLGCLTVGGRPAETVSLRTVHWDTAVVQAVIRRKVAVWESRHPGWELVPDMQRYWEDSTHPSKYVDRDTSIGRKLAWTRFRVERRHPRGVRLRLHNPPHALGRWVEHHYARWIWAQMAGQERAILLRLIEAASPFVQVALLPKVLRPYAPLLEEAISDAEELFSHEGGQG